MEIGKCDGYKPITPSLHSNNVDNLVVLSWLPNIVADGEYNVLFPPHLSTLMIGEVLSSSFICIGDTRFITPPLCTAVMSASQGYAKVNKITTHWTYQSYCIKITPSISICTTRYFIGRQKYRADNTHESSLPNGLSKIIIVKKMVDC